MNFSDYEKLYLSEYAVRSDSTKGRKKALEPCPLRMEFQRDRDRILHSKAFRRLKHKTQVFLSPEGDHYRTRLTHTLEVSQIARTIARALRLNEDLTEAIALGHDIGHTPFGHAGEKVLNNLNPKGFTHNQHSIRVVEVLENDGEGLNLTYEVLDGILCHRADGKPSTLEGMVVSYADRIAYINHDIEDAVSAGLIKESDIPSELSAYLGDSKSKRISKLIKDIVANSEGKPVVQPSEKCMSALSELRRFMFDKVYSNNAAKEEEKKAVFILTELYNYFKSNPEILPELYIDLLKTCDVDTVVTDYLASMTDRYCLKVFNKIFVPESWDA